MNANTRDRIQISNFHAILMADPTVYTSNIVLSPLDTADAGKHKDCDNVRTYAQLPFREDGGSGAGVTSVNGDTGPAVTGMAEVTDLGPRFAFSTTTTDGDPGAGTFRFDNAGLGSVTMIYVDLVDAGGNTITTWLQAISNAGLLQLKQVGGDGLITGTLGVIVGGAGYMKFPFLSIVGSAVPANGTVWAFSPQPVDPVNYLGVLSGQTATAALVRAAAGAAPRHYLNGVAQSGSSYTFTGTTDGSGQLMVNLATATPAMATAFLKDAHGTAADAITGRVVDATIGAFIVEFFDAANAQTAVTQPVSFTVGGTLA